MKPAGRQFAPTSNRFSEPGGLPSFMAIDVPRHDRSVWGDTMRVTRIVLFAVLCVVGLSQAARAQNAGDEGWNVAVYPILAWVPLGIDIDVDVPPINGDAGGAGKIIDSRLDGAFFGGASASNGVWRIEAYAIWASVGGDRPDRPFLD